MRCIVRTYAKINLYLDVLQRRSDGYHDIETIFQSIGLGDTLYLEPTSASTVLTCNHPEVPTDENNLVLRALRALEETAGRPLPTRINLEKKIPVAAGLGGGSADAAGALFALNRVHALGFDASQLQEIGAKLGSDVPFCCLGGTAAGTGRGEILSPLPALAPAWVVLVHLPIQVSTAWVYNHPALTKNFSPRINGMTQKFAQLLSEFPNLPVSRVLYNSMESVIFNTFPEVKEARERLLSCTGVLGVAMSGSGPTLFGIFPEALTAQEAAKTFTYPTSVVPTLPRSIEWLEK